MPVPVRGVIPSARRTQRARRRLAAGLLLGAWLSAGVAAAQRAPIDGLWLSYDDQGRPTGTVRIGQRGGEYFGVIASGLPGDDPQRRCTACPGQLREHAMVGLQIIQGLRRDGEQYVGGRILDPFIGREYQVRLSPSEDGMRLEVRGFVGLELLGRTQVWRRPP